MKRTSRMHALRIPSTSLTPVAGDAARRSRRPSARSPRWRLSFSKTGTAEIASDPMPPNVSDTFVILKPQAEWPDPQPDQGRAGRAQSQAAVRQLPGNNYEFTQPIQMRFNELIAGVRGDVAVKVFGDEFEPMLRAANQIAGDRARRSRARPTCKRRAGVRACRFLEIKVDKTEIARLRLEPRGRAGRDRCGDRRTRGRASCSRATGASISWSGCRNRSARISRPCETCRSRCRARPAGGGSAGHHSAQGRWRRSRQGEGPNQISRENGKRRVVVHANVRGRDIASLVAEAQAKIAEQVALPAGYWIDLGRPVREPDRSPRSG